MTPAEWIKICNRVLDLWGDHTAWQSAKDAAYGQAAPLIFDVAYGKVDAAVLEGRQFPPSPSEIVAATRNAGGVVVVDTPCAHLNVGEVESVGGVAVVGVCAQCLEEFRY